MDKPDTPSSPSASAGQRLAAARAEWGLSVGEVAKYLNLNVATVEALEEQAYDRLPGLTFVKGYLRAYARLLKLDYEEIIGHAGLGPEAMHEIPVARSSLRRARYYAQSKKRGGLLARVLLLVGVLTGLAWVAVERSLLPDANQMMHMLKLPVPLEQNEELDGISLPEAGSGWQNADRNGALLNPE
ncbi:MAG: helix-turn-helix transcriptional regulator [Gammaproteobacteria bacterium]|nr:helix-turn-helix transcriptional regulator [Gammaproteobacteria bacterium]